MPTAFAPLGQHLPGGQFMQDPVSGLMVPVPEEIDNPDSMVDVASLEQTMRSMVGPGAARSFFIGETGPQTQMTEGGWEFTG